MKKAVRKKTQKSTTLPAVPSVDLEQLAPCEIPSKYRNADGSFKKGFNPRALGIDNTPKDPNKRGSGRRRVLSVFDRIVGEEGHLELLELEIRKYIQDHGMLAFYQHYIFPLTPKEMVLTTIGIDQSVPTQINFNFKPRKEKVASDVEES